MYDNAGDLIGPTVNRPRGKRVPINIDESVRQRLRDLLFEEDMRGVGYSEFINRACERAETEIAYKATKIYGKEIL